jgi:hypothetical protein
MVFKLLEGFERGCPSDQFVRELALMLLPLVYLLMGIF